MTNNKEKTNFQNKLSIEKPKKDYDFHPDNYQLTTYQAQNDDFQETIQEEFDKTLLVKPKVSLWVDKYNILILFSIYIASGIGIGYFDGSLTVILTEAGASYSQLSLISFVIYPYSFKFIWAPFCDAFYFSNKWGLGKRKTYIVLSYYILGVLFFVCAFYINGWIFNLETELITVVGFLIIMLITFESIGSDAWSICILHPDNVTYASLALNMGEDLGYIISYNIFVWLNVRGGDTIEEQINNEIISSEDFFFFSAGIFFLIGFLTHVFKKETEISDPKFKSLMKIFGEMKGFVKNKKLLFLGMIFIFSELAFASIDNCGYIILIQKGFSTDLIDAFDLTSTFVGMLGYIISSHFCKNKKEWTIYLYCIVIRFFLDVIMYFIIVNYDSETNNTMMEILYGININIYYIAVDCYAMALYSFILRISEINVSIAATFITGLACMSNFGGTWTYTLAIYLLDYWSFQTITYITWCYGLLFFGFLWKKIKAMEDAKEEEWIL